MSRNARVAEGQLTLSCDRERPYQGVQLIFTLPVRVPAPGEGGLRLRFTMASVRGPNGGYSTRWFLAPGWLAWL